MRHVPRSGHLLEPRAGNRLRVRVGQEAPEEDGHPDDPEGRAGRLLPVGHLPLPGEAQGPRGPDGYPEAVHPDHPLQQEHDGQRQGAQAPRGELQAPDPPEDDQADALARHHVRQPGGSRRPRRRVTATRRRAIANRRPRRLRRRS